MAQDPWIVRRAEDWLAELGLGPRGPEFTLRSIWIEILIEVQRERPLPGTLGELLGSLERSSLTRSQAGRVLTEAVRSRLATCGDSPISRDGGTGT